MDEADDFAVALRLQEQFDREEAASLAAAECHDVTEMMGSGVFGGARGGATSQDQAGMDKMSLVDERWEVLDPNPDVRALFIEFNERYFWGRLAGVEVRWSPRMTLCAGLCCYEGRGGLCSVRLSLPLLKLRPRKDLIETLLHEMIHAYLFVTENNKDHDGHGPEFHKHMYRLNKECGTSISVYHTFHDEVEHHRKHWWRCDGPCRERQPYFGYVKRAMNRAPSPQDPWWPDHARTCGGTYTKVKEPEDYGKKKGGKVDEKKRSPEKPKGVPDIRTLFGGKGAAVGGTRGEKSESSNKQGKNSGSQVATTDEKKKQFSGSQGASGFSTTGSNTVLPGSTNGTTEDTKHRVPTISTIRGKENIAAVSGNELERRKERINTGVKIRTINSGDGKEGCSDELEKDPFTGTGFTLGGLGAEHHGPIVRRIPGVGLVTSQRPVSHTPDRVVAPMKGCLSADGDQELAGSPSRDTTVQTVELSDAGGGNDMPESLSESDTDNILLQLRKKKRKRKKSQPGTSKRNSAGAVSLNNSFKLQENLGDTTPGTFRRISGFMSVSNHEATPPEFVCKDPEAIVHEARWSLTKKGRAGSMTPLGGRGPNHPLPYQWTPTPQPPMDRRNSSSSNMDGWWTSKIDPEPSKMASPSGGSHVPPWPLKTSTPAADRQIPKPYSSVTLSSQNSKPETKKPEKKSRDIPASRALDRNRRALYGNDSDSDSDSDLELQPLSSIMSGTMYKMTSPEHSHTKPLVTSGTSTVSAPRDGRVGTGGPSHTKPLVTSGTSTVSAPRDGRVGTGGPSHTKPLVTSGTSTVSAPRDGRVGTGGPSHTKPLVTSGTSTVSAPRDGRVGTGGPALTDPRKVDLQPSQSSTINQGCMSESRSVSPAGRDQTVPCPVCQIEVLTSQINSHLDLCLI